MLGSDVTNQLLDQDGLTYTSTAEQTDLTTLLIRAEQVYDFDTGLKDLSLGGLFLKGRSFSVDRKVLFHLWLFFIVDRLAQYVENTAQRILTNRYGNRCAGCNGVHTTSQTIGGSHCDTSYGIVTKILCNLDGQGAAILKRYLDCLVDFRNLALGELDIHDRTDDLRDLTSILFCHLASPFISFSNALPGSAIVLAGHQALSKQIN